MHGWFRDFSGRRATEVRAAGCPPSTSGGTPDATNARRNQRGFALVAVLVVTMLASMIAVSLMFRLRAEETASAGGAAGEQAWAAAMSGIYEAMRVVEQARPGSVIWQDYPAAFQHRLVADDGADRWYFSVFTRDARGELRYGLSDEAGKLHLETTPGAMLENLPGMTPSLVESLLEYFGEDAWLDLMAAGSEADDDEETLAPLVANPPFTTLDQLLRVPGFTPQLLYGTPAHPYQRVAVRPAAGEAVTGSDESSTPGLRNFLTLTAYDLNADNRGQPRIHLRSSTTSLLDAGLARTTVDYLIALRRNRIELEHPVELLEARTKIKDKRGAEVEIQSGIGLSELALLLDRFTTTTETSATGLINVNSAPAEVLRTLPEVDDSLAEAIVAARPGLTPEQRLTPAWLLEEMLMDTEPFKRLAPHLTARSFQFRFQVVGYAIPSGRYRVLEAIIDVAPATPTVLYLRDLTRLGMPFNPEAGHG